MKIIDQCGDLARRLVVARKSRGLMARDVARQIGVTATTISRFENGVRTPGIEHIMRLAEFIPVNLHWLLTGRGPKVFTEAEEKNEDPFQIMKDDLPVEGRILVPGIKGVDSVYQLKSTWMEPRIMEDDYIFVDWNPTSVGDLVAFRHQSNRVMAGWLREFGKECKQRIEAEKPQNGSIAASECKIIGRVVCSVRATHYR